jgi:hypothetical protein
MLQCVSKQCFYTVGRILEGLAKTFRLDFNSKNFHYRNGLPKMHQLWSTAYPTWEIHTILLFGGIEAQQPLVRIST